MRAVCWMLIAAAAAALAGGAAAQPQQKLVFCTAKDLRRDIVFVLYVSEVFPGQCQHAWIAGVNGKPGHYSRTLCADGPLSDAFASHVRSRYPIGNAEDFRAFCEEAAEEDLRLDFQMTMEEAREDDRQIIMTGWRP